MSQSASAPDVSQIAGPEWAELVKEQLEEERSRKESLERRGIAVVSVSAFLVTVLLGLGAFAGGEDQALDPAVIWWIRTALVLFLLAVVLGVATNMVRGFEEVRLDALPPLFEKNSSYWSAPLEVGLRRATESRYNTLVAARGKNDTKARLLQVALVIEMVGAFAVAGAVYVVLVP